MMQKVILHGATSAWFQIKCCCTMYVLASTKMLCALIVRVKLNYMNTAYIFSVTLLLFSELFSFLPVGVVGIWKFHCYLHDGVD